MDKPPVLFLHLATVVLGVHASISVPPQYDPIRPAPTTHTHNMLYD